MPFALSGKVEPNVDALSNAEQLEVKAREQEGTIIVQTQLFVFTLDPETGDFGYQSEGIGAIEGEIMDGVFDQLESGGVINEYPSVDSLHIVQNMPFALSVDEFEEYDADEGERRFMRVGGEGVVTYHREIDGFDIFAHSHGEEDIEDVHPHEIIYRNPSDNPADHLVELKEVTDGLEIAGLDFSGHNH